jgi:serine/threonine protein kinase
MHTSRRPLELKLPFLRILSISIYNDAHSSLSQHPNIAYFVGYCESPSAIIMKFYPRSLANALNIPSMQFSSLTCVQIARDVACGLMEMHRREMIHFDLKPGKNYID